ncbi:MAG: ABC transporter substrate-binding protein [Hyphomicrobiales bacterium]
MTDHRQLLGTRFGRRRMLTGSVAAGTGLAALALTGCGDDDDDDDNSNDSNGSNQTQPAGQTASPQASGPKRGGTLTVDAGEPVPSALVFAFNPNNWYLRWAIWDGLIAQGDDNRPQLVLAEAFETKSDFTGVHIQLRSGLTFHDGRPLTAEDVRFSIEKFRADDTTSQLKPPGKLITDIKISDPLTLDITYSSPRPYMEDYFALLPIIDEKTVDQATEMKVLNGAGPFKFVSYTPNQGYVLERNPNYWDQGKPYLDKIEGRIYSDEQAQTLALQSGELMHANNITPATLEAVKSNDKIVTGNAGVGGSWYAGLVVDFPALKDKRVRQALTFAIDRDRIANEWGEGAFKPQVLPWPEQSPAYIPEDEALLSYDPDRAKSLLKEAGAEGFTLPMDIGQGRESIAQYVQDDWKAIGVDAQLNVSEFAAYQERFRQRKVEAMFVATVGFSDYMYPASFFEFAQPVRVPNPSHYDTAEYKDLLSKLAMTDPRSDQGREYLRQWNRLYLVEDPWMVPLAPNLNFFAMQKNVQALPTGARDAPPLSDWWIA